MVWVTRAGLQDGASAVAGRGVPRSQRVIALWLCTRASLARVARLWVPRRTAISNQPGNHLVGRTHASGVRSYRVSRVSVKSMTSLPCCIIFRKEYLPRSAMQAMEVLNNPDATTYRDLGAAAQPDQVTVMAEQVDDCPDGV